MSNFKYIVMSRYELWTFKGKDWSNWFKYRRSKYYDNILEAEECLSNAKEDSKVITKITKLNYEFKIEQIDIDLLPTPAPPQLQKPKRPRGRPKKNAEA